MLKLEWEVKKGLKEHKESAAMKSRLYLLTMTENGIVNYKDEMKYKKGLKIMLLKEYADQLERMGAQFILPLHHTNARASDEDLNLYFQKVNQILEERGCPARAFNPEPYRWFHVYTGIRGE